MFDMRQEAALAAVLVAVGLLPLSAKANLNVSLGLSSHQNVQGTKVAKVCFITDVSDCSGNEFANSDDMGNNGSPDGGGNPDYDLDDAERCRNEGYTISGCPDGFEPSGKCPYGDYYAKCVENCPSNYKTCEPPYYGVGQACGNKYASCEKDTERACKELNPDYTNTCESGWQINPNDKCKYDETFGTCCNQCAGYDYTSIPEGYVQDGEACTDCNGQTKYKVKPNPCDGFMDCGSMGGEVGAETCLSGTVTKYDNCKPCPNLGTLTSCPSPYICEYEECSNRYYKTGCQSGYDWNLTTQTCTAQCDSSYKYTCTGANESPSGSACNGKYQSCQCNRPYSRENDICVCPSMYRYTCTGTGYSGGIGTECDGKYRECSCSNGYFWSGSGCYIYNDCMKGSQLGYILYSDKTRSKEKISGKTPIGVVICSYANGKGQAISLNSIGQYLWSQYRDRTQIKNHQRSSAYQDISSCSNSDILIKAGDATWYPAIWAVKEYSTEGTKAGDWCLPAAGVITSSYVNQDIINQGLSKVGGSSIPTNPWWSSTEEKDYYVWAGRSIVSFSFGLDFELKNSSYKGIVRPVIEF